MRLSPRIPDRVDLQTTINLGGDLPVCLWGSVFQRALARLFQLCVEIGETWMFLCTNRYSARCVRGRVLSSLFACEAGWDHCCVQSAGPPRFKGSLVVKLQKVRHEKVSTANSKVKLQAVGGRDRAFLLGGWVRVREEGWLGRLSGQLREPVDGVPAGLGPHEDGQGAR